MAVDLDRPRAEIVAGAQPFAPRRIDRCSEHGRSGFSDYRHLAVAFRKRLGMTPSAYRRQMRAPLGEDVSALQGSIDGS